VSDADERQTFGNRVSIQGRIEPEHRGELTEVNGAGPEVLKKLNVFASMAVKRAGTVMFSKSRLDALSGGILEPSGGAISLNRESRFADQAIGSMRRGSIAQWGLQDEELVVVHRCTGVEPCGVAADVRFPRAR
jgi:hypothetical protein